MTSKRKLEKPSRDAGVFGAVRALAVDRVSAEVVSAFNAANIPSILLKGPSIARWLYPAGGRTYGDTDLLVPAALFAPAQAVLESLGFIHLLEGWAKSERPSQAPQRTYTRGHGSRPPAIVDLHRSLPQLCVSDQLVWETFSANTDTLKVSGVEATVLDTTALALHIVLHAVQHGHRHHTGEDLRRAVHRLSVEEWGRVLYLAASLGAEDLLTIGLRLDPGGTRIAELLGLPAHTAESSPSWLSFAPRGAASFAVLGYAPNLRERLLCVRWTVFPSRAKVRYVAGVLPRRPWALATAYGRWWTGLVRSSMPALRYLVVHRRVVGRFPLTASTDRPELADGDGDDDAIRMGAARLE